MTEQNKLAGLAWYKPEDYDAALLVMEDRHRLPKTYAAWRVKAEQAEQQLRRTGWATTRAYINPADFVAWCVGRGLNVDAEARKLFANTVAVEAANKA